MISRDYVLSAIKHKETDRIPVDLGATPSSGVSAIAYNNLRKYLAISNGSTRVYDLVQQVAQIEDCMIDLFGVDVLDIGRAYNTRGSDWHEVTLPDGSTAEYPVWFKPVEQPDRSFFAYNNDGVLIGKMPKGATFFDQAVFPYQDGYPNDYKELAIALGKVTWAALAPSPWDHVEDTKFWIQMRAKALSLRNNTDKALIINCGCSLFEWGTFLRKFDNFLVDICSDQTEVERLLDELMARHIQMLTRVCEAMGDIVDIIRFGDDLGMDNGPFMSPSLYRKLFKPRHKQLCDYVKKHSEAHTFFHSCGSIYKLIPDLIEVGYEIINPVQTNCFEMEPHRLKQEFGKDITFWGGGVDTRSIMNRGTVKNVKDDVKRRLEIFSKGGGFVFTPIHNILPDVPPENIVAMFEAVKEFNMS